MCLNREGDILIRSPGGPNGSGKGPPGGEYYPVRKRHATEHDAVQTLGRIIFEALDYGIGEAEERSLSHGLEVLIDTMTRSPQDTDGEGTDGEGQSADDEGIEKDAGEEPAHCAFRDVLRLCSQHLSRGQDASYHYRAVCRALLAEAVELHTFLDKVALSRERLQAAQCGQDSRLLELERADWARLWMQVVRSLRQGVRLKKHEHEEHVRRGHASHPPVEFELTPFEMLLDDIRSRRYTLHKIMVNGDIPPKVKNDAHAVILDFIRSRPPLRQVKDRKLKSLPPKPPDPREQLLQDIRAQPKLRPVRDGRLVDSPGSDESDEAAVDVETSRTRLSSEDSPPPARKVIKPDFNLLLTNSFEQESEDDSELDSPERLSNRTQRFSPLSSPAKDAHNMNATWHLGGVTVAAGGHDAHHGTKLQRRHTIMVCESPTECKLSLQELPPLEEVEEPSPSEEQTPRLQRGSDSPLSGLPDHTLHNGHTLLRGGAGGNTSSGGATRHQGALYRSEHRRSLTMGLTAIPEVEDASDSAGGNAESVPVPNRRHSLPAAPLSHTVGDGIARSALGMGLEDRVHSAGVGLARSGDGGSKTRFDADCRHSGEGVGSGVNVVRAKGGKKPGKEGVKVPCNQGDCMALGRPPVYKEDEEDAAGDQSRDLALLSASEMMHNEIQKRWQNPIECLSLTLEEVTHIRSVLTKAELESLISHSDLYSLVAKSKVCFTCKTTRFTLFGEWGTKCKFCKRTVCSKCMRKMHVPTEHFKNIPVYTLSPTPLTKEAQALIQDYVKTGSPALPGPTSMAVSTTTSSCAAIPGKLSVLDQQKGKRPLQRSQSMTLPTKKSAAVAVSAGQSAKSPLMNICCDCKGMIMEIIRASKTSLAMLQPPGAGPESLGGPSPLSSPSSTSASSTTSSGSSSN